MSKKTKILIAKIIVFPFCLAIVIIISPLMILGEFVELLDRIYKTIDEK